MREDKPQDPVFPPKEGLATPHFDESAIAAARPVQPLQYRTRRTFNLGRVPRRAAVLASVILSISVIVGLSIAAQDDRAQTSPAMVELQTDSLAEVNAASQAEMDRRAPVTSRNQRNAKSRRPRSETMTLIFHSGRSQNGARKVGEIRY